MFLLFVLILFKSDTVAFLGKPVRIKTCPIIFFVIPSGVNFTRAGPVPESRARIIRKIADKPEDSDVRDRRTEIENRIVKLKDAFTECAEIIPFETDGPSDWRTVYWLEKECAKRRRITTCVVFSNFAKGEIVLHSVPVFTDVDGLLNRVRTQKIEAHMDETGRTHKIIVWTGPLDALD